MNSPKQPKIKPLSNDAFFDAVAQATYLEEDTVKKVYNGMLQVLYSELRSKGRVRFPALCTFDFILSRSKRVKSKFMKEAIFKPPHRQIRIAPTQEVRNYFKAMQ